MLARRLFLSGDLAESAGGAVGDLPYTEACVRVSAKAKKWIVGGRRAGQWKNNFSAYPDAVSGSGRSNCLCGGRAGELTAGMHEELPRAPRLCCDVYTQCTKEAGILMALRCMNPQYIVCDELGTRAEANALEQGWPPGWRSWHRYIAAHRRSYPGNRPFHVWYRPVRFRTRFFWMAGRTRERLQNG